METPLVLILPQPDPDCRLEKTLRAALTEYDSLPVLDSPFELEEYPGAPVLFCIQLDAAGLSLGYTALLSWLRTHPNGMEGHLAGIVVDCPGELYSKSAGRELALAANMSGAAILGRGLVEATGSLENFRVRSNTAGTSLADAYRDALADLARRLTEWQAPAHKENPDILVLHASTRTTSNTLDLWSNIQSHLPGGQVQEYGLRNGTLADCAGCSYHTCLHYGEQGSCFYGGVMVDEVYPALRRADALVMLCPNYNDALSANMTAFINRLTALFRAEGSFAEKQLFALVVSGYSGGDIVAMQLVSALCLNKGFFLPPHFVLFETANDRGSALKLPGIEQRLTDYARRIEQALFRLQGGLP